MPMPLAMTAPILKAAPLLLLCVYAVPSVAQDLSAFEKHQIPNLVETYKTVHAHPELSHHEEQTSTLVAGELHNAGYTVTDDIGVYPDGTKAFGVVGILKNGAGPTLLIRGDMDALPIIEETGLSYASHISRRTSPARKLASCMPAATTFTLPSSLAPFAHSHLRSPNGTALS